MPINQEKIKALEDKMKLLGLHEEDIEEKFILGAGKGGQKVNKSHACVYLKHLPSQIEIKCQKDRSQNMNRFFARRKLCEVYQEKILGQRTQKEEKRDKIRKQKKRRSRKNREKKL